MAQIKPFRALRPNPEQAAAVSAVPYDVVNADEARTLAGENPLSFLRVSRPEIELPSVADPYSQEVYARGAANFDRLIQTAPLVTEDNPAFYLYRLTMGTHQQTGLVACCSIDEYDTDIVRKHERTRKDKEDDRTNHMLALRAQTGPVFLTYRPSSTVNELVNAMTQAAPMFDFTAPDGVSHTIWRVPGQLNDALGNAFREVPLLYIADGHHRAKSASRTRETMRAANVNHSGAEEYNFFQGVLFPADQLRILPYNRAIKDLNHYTLDEFLAEVRRDFEVAPEAAPTPAKRGYFSMYLNEKWYGLRLRTDVTKRIRTIDRLDASILQDLLLARVLGIQDPRTDKRIDFIGGIRGPQELEHLVNTGKAAVAFSLYPVSLDELMEISDAGEIMPPKSTWFEPKLRDGLLSHLI